jgi:hypothetical protein
MSYIVFDLDATLAELDPIFYFLCDLRHNSITDILPPEELKQPLDNAYSSLVQQIANIEASELPLGLLRPGILDVMAELNELKKAGLVKGLVIYSNNGYLANLELVRDIIHAYLKVDDLFCDLIYWGHKDRTIEHTEPRRPGAANKTWEVLSNILVNGPCKADASITAKQVYFFDDQLHPNLMEKLKGRNYKIVEPYKFYASFERLAELYKYALYDANIIPNESLVHALFKYSGYRCSRTSPTNTLDNKIDSLIEKYRKLTRKTSHVDAIPPGPDLGIIAMYNVIRTIKFNLAGGSKTMKRRSHRSHRKQYRKTRIVNRR